MDFSFEQFNENENPIELFIQAFSLQIKTELGADALRIMCLTQSFVRF